jgi:hypothetical protein
MLLIVITHTALRLRAGECCPPLSARSPASRALSVFVPFHNFMNRCIVSPNERLFLGTALPFHLSFETQGIRISGNFL